MRYINNPYTDVYFNLAAEEYLLKNSMDNIFMLYQNEPSVVVGKYQNVNAEVNLDFAKENGLKVARRISGGGAVFHDMGNLNLTFIENNPHPDFKKYTHQILEFLYELGVCVRMDDRHGIFIENLKLSGSAQYIFKNRILYHATLLYSSNLDMLFPALNGKSAQVKQQIVPQKTFVKSVKSPVANLVEYLENPLKIIDFKNVVLDHFFNTQIDTMMYTFSENDIVLINALKTGKYEKNEWIFND